MTSDGLKIFSPQMPQTGINILAEKIRNKKAPPACCTVCHPEVDSVEDDLIGSDGNSSDWLRARIRPQACGLMHMSRVNSHVYSHCDSMRSHQGIPGIHSAQSHCMFTNRVPAISFFNYIGEFNIYIFSLADVT